MNSADDYRERSDRVPLDLLRGAPFPLAGDHYKIVPESVGTLFLSVGNTTVVGKPLKQCGRLSRQADIRRGSGARSYMDSTTDERTRPPSKQPARESCLSGTLCIARSTGQTQSRPT